MTARNAINTVKRFTAQYGTLVSWEEFEEVENSRGINITQKTGKMVNAKLLLMSEKWSVLKPLIETFGLSQDYTKYLLVLPDINLKKDMVIIDNNYQKWKIGIIDTKDIAGVPIFKQINLIEVK